MFWLECDVISLPYYAQPGSPPSFTSSDYAHAYERETEYDIAKYELFGQLKGLLDLQVAKYVGRSQTSKCG